MAFSMNNERLVGFFPQRSYFLRLRSRQKRNGRSPQSSGERPSLAVWQLFGY